MKTVEILLVEDNPDDVIFTTQALKRSGLDCHITLLRDGEEALRFLLHAQQESGCIPVQLILLDLRLPKIDGLEVLKTVRSMTGCETLPIMVLTASTWEKDKVNSQALGVTNYLEKLDDIKQLAQAFKTLWPSLIGQKK